MASVMCVKQLLFNGVLCSTYQWESCLQAVCCTLNAAVQGLHLAALFDFLLLVRLVDVGDSAASGDTSLPVPACDASTCKGKG